MYVPRRRPAAKRRQRRSAPGRSAKPRRKMVRRGIEYASCKEVYTVDNMQSNTPYSDTEQNLGDYPRASAIAKNYQFFRIKYIKYKFIARYNTFQGTSNEANAFPIPYMYTMVDKGGALPTTTTIAQLKGEGARPIKFTRDINVAWKPGVSIMTSNNENTAVLGTSYKISPWILTNRSTENNTWAVNDTDHKGLYWYLECAALPGDGTYSYDAEVTVCFEFKKPLVVPPSGAPEAINVHTHMAHVS